MITVPITKAVGALKLVERTTYEYEAAKMLGNYLNG